MTDRLVAPEASEREQRALDALTEYDPEYISTGGNMTAVRVESGSIEILITDADVIGWDGPPYAVTAYRLTEPSEGDELRQIMCDHVDCVRDAVRELLEADLGGVAESEEVREFRATFEQFQQASERLNLAWAHAAIPADVFGDTYPESLPSFDEVAFEVASMKLNLKGGE